MQKTIVCICALLVLSVSFAHSQQNKNIPTIYVDDQGVMRWSDSKEEASFFGVNYTTSFAHAFRALKYKGIDHKQAIDRDVYHLKRLGFNAYRIHIWDVEISDAEGNLLENTHLDLLDYLFYKLEQQGMRILVTTMTNFGNGYPERNQNTGAFSYLYDKCRVHDDPQAIAAQKRYVQQLVDHVNPYNGKAYKDDPYIIGFEINNEPCHQSTVSSTENYIREMVHSIRSTGYAKPLFYNVSHNMDHVSAYFQADVQGGTYQWYPIGLVAGKERKGNFLPYVADYPIPFSNENGFDNKVKAVYEYDPADVLYSYIHPAMTRTFRSKGFQWITQFAYDPIDIAAYNTEYQTHYLNLAYTPAKALSMLIAAEVAYNTPRNQSFDPYPRDTAFGNFAVSYKQDLAIMNTPEKYYYTNHTSVPPVNAKKLEKIAGHGSSPIITYGGSGAYFLDQLKDGLWRLEVMPDAEQIADPFAKPSLSREVVKILWSEHDLSVNLPDLGSTFIWKRLAPEVLGSGTADKGTFKVAPGVYLLSKNRKGMEKWEATTPWNGYTLGQFVAPAPSVTEIPIVLHTPLKFHERGQDLTVNLKVVSSVKPDSILIQNDQVSFWRDHNPYLKLNEVGGSTYTTIFPKEMLGDDDLRYTATVYIGNQKFTFPQDIEGAPLDWDVQIEKYWSTNIVAPDAPIILWDVMDGKQDALEWYAIPETSYVALERIRASPATLPTLSYKMINAENGVRFFWLKDILSGTSGRRSSLSKVQYLCIHVGNESFGASLRAGFVSDMGYTYTAEVAMEKNAELQIVRIPLHRLELVPTALLPAPFPTFLERYFVPKIKLPFDITAIEKLVIATEGQVGEGSKITIGSVWLE